MENDPAARVTFEIKVENSGDVWNARNGRLTAGDVRTATIPAVVVEPGAMLVALPTSLIRQLGLVKYDEKRVVARNGSIAAGIYTSVWLTIKGRSCTSDVLEVADGLPAMVGQIPLEQLKLVVDRQSHTLAYDPIFGDVHTYEV